MWLVLYSLVARTAVCGLGLCCESSVNLHNFNGRSIFDFFSFLPVLSQLFRPPPPALIFWNQLLPVSHTFSGLLAGIRRRGEFFADETMESTLCIDHNVWYFFFYLFLFSYYSETLPWLLQVSNKIGRVWSCLEYTFFMIFFECNWNLCQRQFFLYNEVLLGLL